MNKIEKEVMSVVKSGGTRSIYPIEEETALIFKSENNLMVRETKSLDNDCDFSGSQFEFFDISNDCKSVASASILYDEYDCSGKLEFTASMDEYDQDCYEVAENMPFDEVCNWIYIQDITVSKKSRGKGIGTDIVKFFIAKNDMCSNIMLSVYDDDSEGLIGMYKKIFKESRFPKCTTIKNHMYFEEEEQ